MDKKILFRTFRNTIGAAAYIYVISQVLNNSNIIFGNGGSEIIGSFLLLLMFVLSAAIVGGLVFGESVIQFVNKKTKDGITAAIYSVGWLFIYTLICALLIRVLK